MVVPPHQKGTDPSIHLFFGPWNMMESIEIVSTSTVHVERPTPRMGTGTVRNPSEPTGFEADGSWTIDPRWG